MRLEPELLAGLRLGTRDPRVAEVGVFPSGPRMRRGETPQTGRGDPNPSALDRVLAWRDGQQNGIPVGPSFLPHPLLLQPQTTPNGARFGFGIFWGREKVTFAVEVHYSAGGFWEGRRRSPPLSALYGTVSTSQPLPYCFRVCVGFVFQFAQPASTSDVYSES